MGKIRVYELARELKIESKVLLAQMAEAKINVASHQRPVFPKKLNLQNLSNITQCVFRTSCTKTWNEIDMIMCIILYYT